MNSVLPPPMSITSVGDLAKRGQPMTPANTSRASLSPLSTSTAWPSASSNSAGLLESRTALVAMIRVSLQSFALAKASSSFTAATVAWIGSAWSLPPE